MSEEYIKSLEKRNEELEKELQEATNKISELEKEVERLTPYVVNGKKGNTYGGDFIFSSNIKSNNNVILSGFDAGSSITISPKLEDRIKKLETHMEQLNCPFYVRWYRKLKLLLKK